MNNLNRIFKEVLQSTQNNDATTEILNLWTQYSVLLSRLCETAAITKLDEIYSTKEAKKYIISWPNMVEEIKAFRNKLDYCVNNDLPNLVNGKSERLFNLSDGREQAILSLKNLVEDLRKTTEPNTMRYNNLRTSIISLFNSLNILLTEVGRILGDSNYPITTNTYNLTNITRRDIGLIN
jgi:hypothetical protein